MDKDKVELLLLTTSANEFNAVLYCMAKRHIEDRNLEDSDKPKPLKIENEYFYIGNFAEIPTAVVKHDQRSSRSYVDKAIDNFCNLQAIVSVGACGTYGNIGDVMISSKIVVYEDNDGRKSVNKSLYTSQSLLKHLKTGDWEFDCFTDVCPVKWLSQFHDGPFLSPSTPETYEKFSRKDLCEDAMATDMEGTKIADAIESHRGIEFIIVKAGYKSEESANNEKYKSAWEPVAAMASTKFLYEKFAKLQPPDRFKGTCACTYWSWEIFNKSPILQDFSTAIMAL